VFRGSAGTGPRTPAGPVEQLISELGGIGVLVNNAATGHRDPVLDLSYDDWRRVVDTDLTGAFLCAQVAARTMMDAGQGRASFNASITTSARSWVLDCSGVGLREQLSIVARTWGTSVVVARPGTYPRGRWPTRWFALRADGS
jgi:NAD(P)-dependent dehydrogenase (short-subunit alcohol dehydrogenase family)